MSVEAELIGGTAISAAIRCEVAQQVKSLQSDHGVTPGLAVVSILS